MIFVKARQIILQVKLILYCCKSLYMLHLPISIEFSSNIISVKDLEFFINFDNYFFTMLINFLAAKTNNIFLSYLY